HIPHEDFPAKSHCAGLDHAFGRLGTEHDLADERGVSDRDGPSGLNLTPERLDEIPPARLDYGRFTGGNANRVTRNSRGRRQLRQARAGLRSEPAD
ncbi:MAG: hypothetical protein V3T13_08260, partial [Hyphomicrobium sp.]